MSRNTLDDKILRFVDDSSRSKYLGTYYICYTFVILTILSQLSIHSVRVLFTFDSEFYAAFDGIDGKSGDNYMNEVMALVKNAFRDKSLKNAIGTRVNIIGTKKLHTGPITSVYDPIIGYEPIMGLL